MRKDSKTILCPRYGDADLHRCGFDPRLSPFCSTPCRQSRSGGEKQRSAISVLLCLGHPIPICDLFVPNLHSPCA